MPPGSPSEQRRRPGLPLIMSTRRDAAPRSPLVTGSSRPADVPATAASRSCGTCRRGQGPGRLPIALDNRRYARVRCGMSLPTASAPELDARRRPTTDRGSRLPGDRLPLLALLCHPASTPCAKWLVLHGFLQTQVAFVRCRPFSRSSAPSVRLRRTALADRVNLPTMSIRALALLGSTLNFAVRRLPAADHDRGDRILRAALDLLPSIPLLGETVGLRRWMACWSRLGGRILVVARPWDRHLHPAILFCLAQRSVGFALRSWRMLAGRDTTNTQQFYAGLPPPPAAPFAAGAWTVERRGSWFRPSAIGVRLGGHQLITIASRFAPASTLAPFTTYVQIVAMTASGS